MYRLSTQTKTLALRVLILWQFFHVWHYNCSTLSDVSVVAFVVQQYHEQLTPCLHPVHVKHELNHSKMYTKCMLTSDVTSYWDFQQWLSSLQSAVNLSNSVAGWGQPGQLKVLITVLAVIVINDNLLVFYVLNYWLQQNHPAPLVVMTSVLTTLLLRQNGK